MTEAPKEGDTAPRSTEKEFTTKAEYNRALVRQEKWATAEEMRKEGKAGDEVIKDRQRKHTTQGLSRQQAAAVQMKKASESLEAHRQQNLTLGRAVYEEVAGWRQGAKATKDEWSAYGKTLKESIKAENKTAESVAALSQKKKQQAAETRRDDEMKAKQLEELKASQAAAAAEQAARIRAETADKVIDQAKRHFYEQRLKQAVDTKQAQMQWEKERAAEKEKHQDAQNKRRLKAKSARMGSSTSRSKLAAERAQEAAAMREQKRALAEAHKRRMQEDYQDKAATVKGVIANSFVQPSETLDATSPERSFYSVTNIRSPSPERGDS